MAVFVHGLPERWDFEQGLFRQQDHDHDYDEVRMTPSSDQVNDPATHGDCDSRQGSGGDMLSPSGFQLLISIG